MRAPARALAENASFHAFINCYFKEVDKGEDLCAREWNKSNPKLDLIGDKIRILSMAQSRSYNCSTIYNDIDSQEKLKNEKHFRIESPQAVQKKGHTSNTQHYAFDMCYQSLVGCDKVANVYKNEGQGWQIDSFWNVLLALVKNLYERHQFVAKDESSRKHFELIFRLADSLQNMSSYIEHWQNQHSTQLKLSKQANLKNSFIKAEQALAFGHWQHPTPKSRQGCSDWQQKLFSPELEGRFQLFLFAVNNDLILQQSEDNQTSTQLIHEIYSKECVLLKSNESLIPLHPLQANYLQYQEPIKELIKSKKIRALGHHGPFFSATSSVRTVYNEDLPWMFKLSIPVKLTNSLRVNKIHELYAGSLMSRLLRSLDVKNSFTRFSFIEDPAWITLNLSNDKNSCDKESGFECILRENIFKQTDNRNVNCIAYLSQEALPNEKYPSKLAEIVTNYAQDQSLSLSEAALRWFEQYWLCAIEPCIDIYDKHGIALEAHQQNVLLELEDNLPVKAYFRDNQGFYLSKERKKELCHKLNELSENFDLFYSEAMINPRFSYYLFINQIFSIVHRLGADGLIQERSLIRFLINRLREKSSRLLNSGLGLVDYLLKSPTLARKANLLTRVKDIDELEAEQELAVYIDYDNPISAATCEKTQPQENITNLEAAEYA